VKISLPYGTFSVKLGYNAWEEDCFTGPQKWWWGLLWKSKAPTRCKISLWLALNNKLLNWDNYIKRGWCEPNCCILCKNDSESIDHLFIFCPYAAQVMKLIKEELDPKTSWNKGSLDENLKEWAMDRSVKLYANLPSLFVSSIWWARNSDTFKDKQIQPEITTLITLNQAVDFKEDVKEKIPRNPILPLTMIYLGGTLMGQVKVTLQSVE
jgi:hypothetical protein